MYRKLKNLTKDQAITESIEIMCQEGKSLKDYIFQSIKKGRKEGRLEGIQEGMQEGKIIILTNNILKMNINGFPAKKIANILDLDINFVENIIAKNN